MKTHRTHCAKPIHILLVLIVACPTLCADFFDRIAPTSLCTQIIEICMRIISDSTKNYDESTHIDLCVGRLIRLSAATNKLTQASFTSEHLLERDIKYLMSLTNIAKTKQHCVLATSAHAHSLMNAAQAHIAHMLEPH